MPSAASRRMLKVGGRALLWVMYLSLMRRPDIAGGECASTASRSH